MIFFERVHSLGNIEAIDFSQTARRDDPTDAQ